VFTRGLATVSGADGTLIAFATQPNRVAADGSGRNSPFTQSLLKNLPTPGLELRTLMTRVRAEVVKATWRRAAARSLGQPGRGIRVQDGAVMARSAFRATHQVQPSSILRPKALGLEILLNVLTLADERALPQGR
jgi:uncharacterized caspase-like protein